jgi:hypothetical protein
MNVSCILSKASSGLLARPSSAAYIALCSTKSYVILMKPDNFGVKFCTSWKTPVGLVNTKYGKEANNSTFEDVAGKPIIE